MALEKSPDCGAAARDSMLAHRGNDLVESQIRLLADQSQQPPRASPTARCSLRSALLWRFQCHASVATISPPNWRSG